MVDKMVERLDTRSFIAITLTLSMVALTFVLAFKIPESDAFKILEGAMLTVGFASVIGWYFNSSASSEKKDAPIMAAAFAKNETPNSPPPAPVSTTTTVTADATVTKTEPAPTPVEPAAPAAPAPI
jgi:hypothetical protein